MLAFTVREKAKSTVMPKPAALKINMRRGSSASKPVVKLHIATAVVSISSSHRLRDGSTERPHDGVKKKSP